MSSRAARLQSFYNRTGCVAEVIGDRNHANLLRSQPHRERTGVMLDESADESLHRADEHAMQHHRTLRRVVGARVLNVEPLGQIEIELDCRSLPLSANRVDQLEIE